ncbi:isochorismate synthase [Luteimonas yindakuii]|uniref:isochorismate synthase n=1 Tax=Luteimonas yindakuii TaxID=2565782 RepID=UPI0010A3831D|nr:isochorismate synthase [Luteimonas yindakuii]QCO67290.1 isochorismate synthase [Luteimonas yindakuii]
MSEGPLSIATDLPASAPWCGPASPGAFRLHTPSERLDAVGCLARLPSGPTDTLGARVDAFFAARRSGPGLLVGALPFDPHADDALYQPERVGAAAPGSRDDGACLRPSAAVAEPSEADYAAAVSRCVARLDTADAPHGLHKVVLARSLRVEAAAPVDPQRLAARLGEDASVTTYVMPLPVAAGEAPAWLVGATPELLVSRRGTAVVSHPLAGSARRWREPARDAAAARALLASGKDHEEHHHVVEAILDTLAPLCSRLHAPVAPSLHATRTMWHLGTRIEGTLKDPAVSSAHLAGLLHPTPAVCGTPRLPALEAIRALEPVDRGFYAGAVGWTDADGDGEWHVSIRCARVQGRVLRLFAGAGIVAGSEPALEVDETAGKFRAMLDALGIDDLRTA